MSSLSDSTPHCKDILIQQKPLESLSTYSSYNSESYDSSERSYYQGSEGLTPDDFFEFSESGIKLLLSFIIS